MPSQLGKGVDHEGHHGRCGNCLANQVHALWPKQDGAGCCDRGHVAPSGRLKLETSPSSTGSTPVAKTMCVTEIAARTARTLTSRPHAKITATLRPTKSAASPGSRSK